MSELIKEMMTEIGYQYEIKENYIIVEGYETLKYTVDSFKALCDSMGKKEAIDELKHMMNIEVNTEEEKIFIQEIKEAVTNIKTVKANKIPVLEILNEYLEDIEETHIYTSINVLTMIEASQYFFYKPNPENYEDKPGCLKEIGYYQVDNKKFPVSVWTLEYKEEYFIVNGNKINFKGKFKELHLSFWKYFKLRFIMSKLYWILLGRRKYRKQLIERMKGINEVKKILTK